MAQVSCGKDEPACVCRKESVNRWFLLHGVYFKAVGVQPASLGLLPRGDSALALSL